MVVFAMAQFQYRFGGIRTECTCRRYAAKAEKITIDWVKNKYSVASQIFQKPPLEF